MTASPHPAEPAPVLTGATLAAVAAEAARAHRKHGDFSMAAPAHTPHTRLAVLTEEVGEVAHLLTYDSYGTPADLYRELVQVAAMAATWAQQVATDPCHDIKF